MPPFSYRWTTTGGPSGRSLKHIWPVSGLRSRAVPPPQKRQRRAPRTWRCGTRESTQLLFCRSVFFAVPKSIRYFEKHVIYDATFRSNARSGFDPFDHRVSLFPDFPSLIMNLAHNFFLTATVV